MSGKSWASVAVTEPAPVKPTVTAQSECDAKSYVVLDASAIIGGVIFRDYTQTLVTTPDVLLEIRDKQSKRAVDAVPFGMTTLEPSEESIAAVTKFARATGEIHSLSAQDTRLIALAHTLHVAQHGSGSLQSEPLPARPVGKGRRSDKQLPGWGALGGSWEVLDRMDEAALTAEEQARGTSAESKIAAEIQELNLSSGPVQPGTPLQQDEPRSSAGQASPSSEPTQGPEELLASQQRAGVASESGSDSGDEWEVAAKSKNALRRKRRKNARRSERTPQQPAVQHHGTLENGTGPDQPDQQGASEEPAFEGLVAADRGAQEIDRDGAEDSPTEGEDAEPPTTANSSEASVMTATADFAMQNVILQMGLRLATPDGRRITCVRRWVLRCSACFKVTKEMERLFCPACGNASLEKVEVVIGENGTEQFGVRKRHIIRGTKFTLPKPKGGKHAGQDPILREDVLLQRLPKKKPTVAGTDPFVPEYTASTWHNLRGAGPVAAHKGAAAALASWKHNPNERRHTRSNRRK